MSRVNILKRVKIGARWKLLSIPRNDKGNPNWALCPKVDTSSSGIWAASGGASSAVPRLPKPWNHRSENGMNWRAGTSAFQASTKPANRPRILLSHRYFPLSGSSRDSEKAETLRKYQAVLERFAEYFTNRSTIRDISPEDLNRFIVDLMKNHHMAANTVIHNVIIIAQFLKRQGRRTSPGIAFAGKDHDPPLRVRRTGPCTFLRGLQ